MVRKTKDTTESTGKWPKIKQGSHLTVKTFEDGSTELIWDDAALLRDVQDAILKHDSASPVVNKQSKTVRKKKD